MKARPLSPHLQVYKPQLTSFSSISHRISGVVLSAAALMLTVGLLALSHGAAAFERFMGFADSWIGRLIVGAFVLASVYHWLNGIRHLLWDTGWGLDLKRAYATGWAVMIATPLISAAILYVFWS
jgi:succinate dehydrogenase / fumarate reductase cytochrome b subunit